MPKRTVLPPLDAEARSNLLARYNGAPDPETRTRFQMVLLAVEQGPTTYQIAPLDLCFNQDQASRRHERPPRDDSRDEIVGIRPLS